MVTLPVREETKRTMNRLKPSGWSWDQLLRHLLETRPLPAWEEDIERRAAREPEAVRVRKLRREDAWSVTRDPAEQRTLSEVARRRWDRWVETGRVEVLGPRRLRMRTVDPRQETEEPPHVRIRRVR